MRPLGFFSRSLNRTQQNWTVWERELLSALEAALFFSAIISGCAVTVHTDHLTSTLLNAELKQPAKVLRMLLRLDSLAKIKIAVPSGKDERDRGRHFAEPVGPRCRPGHC